MELYTQISLPKAGFSFSYEDHILMMGSCFANNIGRKLEENKFNTDINPFGTLYNPLSIAQGLQRLLYPTPFGEKDIFQYEGIYHSFSHHSAFSATSKDDCLDQINKRLTQSAVFLQSATRLIITLGTAFVYRLKTNNEVVSNCHKLPESMFKREKLSIETITDKWDSLQESIWKINPNLNILFTISPIRHWKDGAHENQLSKATLLLAVDKLQKKFPKQIAYFPAYEILMDELRDYRFYADDMLHPSPLAIDYIWQRFTETFLTKETTRLLKEWNEILKAINHKPFQPESEAYKRFLLQTLLKMEHINKIIHSFDIQKEIEIVKAKLK